MSHLVTFHFPRVLFFIIVMSGCVLGQPEKKASYILLLDNTGSMKTQWPQVLTLGKGIVSRLHRRGPISIFNFKTQDSFAVVAAGREWSQDETTLNNYIDSLSIATGQTALFDAVESSAAAWAAKVDADKVTPEDKVLILITDGDERIRRRGPGISTSSQDEEDRWRKARDQVIKKLKGLGITVYAIGLTRELDADSLVRVSAREKAETFLTKLAKQTGGRAVISRSKKIDVDSLLKELLGQ